MGVGSMRRFHGGRDAYLPNLEDGVGEDPRGILDGNHREEFDQPYGEKAARNLAAVERREKGNAPIEEIPPKGRKKKKGEIRDPVQSRALERAAEKGFLPDGDHRPPVRYPEEVAAEMNLPPSITLPEGTPPADPGLATTNTDGVRTEGAGLEGGVRAAPPGTNPAPGTVPTTKTTPVGPGQRVTTTPEKVPPTAKPQHRSKR